MKILVRVSVPCIEETYDIWIPDDVKIRTVIEMLSNSARILSDNRYVPSGNECLCLKEGKKLFQPDLCLNNYNVKNGERMVLI